MKTHRLTLSVLSALAGLVSVLAISGCSANFGNSANVASQTSVHIQGTVHGGQPPLVGARVYMYAAGTGGYGQPSVSLLTSGPATSFDGTNYYVTTDGGGNFDIAGEFACTANTQVYLYGIGGQPGPGAGDNSAAGLLAVVGQCGAGNSFPASVTFVSMNEVSTIATAYALAGYATDALHISSPSATSLQAQTGIANAANNAFNLVVQSTGLSMARTPAGNGTVPVSKINTLADMLASCINSSGPSSTGCTILFSNTSNGTGTHPTETASAAIDIAQHPASSIGNLLSLANPLSPFQPITAMTDFSIGIVYSDSSISDPRTIAIDSAGNAWVSNFGNNSVTELSSNGAVLSGAGYGTSVLNAPSGLAIDAQTGTVWVTNTNTALLQPYAVNTFSSSGALNGTYTDHGIDAPLSISVDGSGNAWIPNTGGLLGALSSTMTEISRSGSYLSGSSGYDLGILDQPIGSATDALGNVWIAASILADLTKVTPSGTPTTYLLNGGILGGTGVAIDQGGNIWVASAGVVGLLGDITKSSLNGSVLTSTPYSGPLLTAPTGIAIDGADNVWSVNSGTSALIALTNAGVPRTGNNGFHIPGLIAGAFSVAVDSSGDVWVPNSSTGGNSVTEMIGLATPVVTPLAASLTTPYGTPASLP